MKRVIIAAVMAFSPAVALADHNHHGAHDHAPSAPQSMLTASTPSDGAVLASAPQSLALMFGHPVLLQRLTVIGPAGPVSTNFRATSSPATSFTIALSPGLAAGDYAARWSASGDGHQMSGVIRFVVQ